MDLDYVILLRILFFALLDQLSCAFFTLGLNVASNVSSTTFLWTLFHIIIALIGRKFFLVFSLNFSFAQFHPVVSIYVFLHI